MLNPETEYDRHHFKESDIVNIDDFVPSGSYNLTT